MPGVVRVLTHKDVPNNVYTILSLIQVEPDDEPVLADDKVRFKGEAVVAVLAETEAAAREAVGAGEGRLRGAAGRLRRRGGAEARRAARQRVSRPRTTSPTRATTAAASASATSRRASPRPTTSSRSATSPRRSSTRRPRPPAASSCRRRNGRFTCYSNTQALFFTLDNAGADPRRAVPASCA